MEYMNSILKINILAGLALTAFVLPSFYTASAQISLPALRARQTIDTISNFDTNTIAQPWKSATQINLEEPLLSEGDAIEVFVFEDAGFNGNYRIMPGGYVVIPQIGQFHVLGMTPSETEKILKTRLEQNLLHKATVSVLATCKNHTISSGIVYVIGSVRNAGVVHIPQGETLTILTAIIRAGGISPKADTKQVQLARLTNGKREVSFMNFDAVLAGYESGTELALQDGDIVNVVGREGIDINKESPPGYGTIYLEGRVKRPGPHAIEDLTVYRTIMRNGGFDRFANMKKVYVLRIENGKHLKIPVNIDAIIKEGALDLDIPVKQGDIIVVPERFFSF